jgi:hypothetical protein
MPKGLAMPLGISKSGGAKVEKEESQLDKLVILALEEGEDDNPFQELGLPPRVVYRVNDTSSLFDVKSEIEDLLKRSFQGRLKLVSEGVVIEESKNDTNKEGERNVSFEYINLDVNQEREFSSPLEELGDR